ncbi:unnamed protein product [Rotaria magnacalcarata]|uniref:Uncharacterized protein n=1 Tax=Rotaria magnacalcarata TaxID=392030 RepID=A0A815L8F0_9BILA|nr:unnamed protein product [Rotaria magnacalcarata]CAF5048149.1 unnamed protein product [Rotaria magnacalcarata]
MQHELSDQLQQFDDKGQLIHLNYLYEYGARYQFNEQFHRIWPEYFNQHPNLSIQKYEFSVKQENNDQRQLPSIQSCSSSNDTPTKISTLTEKEDIIHSQEVQATDDMPPLASLLNCFVRIERCRVDKDIYIPGKNLEANHELQEQEAEKEQHKTALSVETKETLSLYDADPYLEDNNSMNNMMILGSPLSQPLNFDTIE